MIRVACILAAVALGAEYDLLGLAPVPDYGLIGESNPSPGSAPAADSQSDAPRPRALLYFTASWCGPCKTMRPIVDGLKGEGVDVRTTDVDAKTKTAAAWGVGPVPAFIVAEQRDDGWHEVGRITGATTEAALRQLLETKP
jgi:thioredoxin 1